MMILLVLNLFHFEFHNNVNNRSMKLVHAILKTTHSLKYLWSHVIYSFPYKVVPSRITATIVQIIQTVPVHVHDS